MTFKHPFIPGSSPGRCLLILSPAIGGEGKLLCQALSGNGLAGAACLADTAGNPPKQTAEQPHGYPVNPSRPEFGFRHEVQEKPVSVHALEWQPVGQELVERIVDERRVIGLGPAGIGVYDAIGHADQDIEDTELRRASVPSIEVSLPCRASREHFGSFDHFTNRQNRERPTGQA